MRNCHWVVATSVAILLSVSGSAIRPMEPAPVQYKGQPLQSVIANNGHVYALYGTKPYGREWLPLTTDTVPRLDLKLESRLLSPDRIHEAYQFDRVGAHRHVHLEPGPTAHRLCHVKCATKSGLVVLRSPDVDVLIGHVGQNHGGTARLFE